MSDAADIVDVVVPAPGRLGHVAPGSGIVAASPARDGRRAVCFEGNLHGSEDLAGWADRVFVAATRLLADAPTVARAAVDGADVERVGVISMRDGLVTLDGPRARRRLAGWLGVARHRMLRAVREAAASDDPQRRAAAAWMSRRYGLGIDVPGVRF